MEFRNCNSCSACAVSNPPQKYNHELPAKSSSRFIVQGTPKLLVKEKKSCTIPFHHVLHSKHLGSQQGSDHCCGITPSSSLCFVIAKTMLLISPVITIIIIISTTAMALNARLVATNSTLRSDHTLLWPKPPAEEYPRLWFTFVATGAAEKIQAKMGKKGITPLATTMLDTHTHIDK